MLGLECRCIQAHSMLNLLEGELSAVSKLPPCAVVKLAPLPPFHSTLVDLIIVSARSGL